VPDEDRETGQPVERKRFIGAPVCGLNAVVSYTQDGAVQHRCTAHMPRRPRDGTSTDPRSIGGSERFKYLL
jgi:hypothetical protein